MNEIVSTPLSPAHLALGDSGIDATQVRAALDAAAAKVAPLWPLDSFVAVNPFVGLADRSFDGAARHLAAVAGTRLTMPRAFYGRALAQGRMIESDLDAALREASRRAPSELGTKTLATLATEALDQPPRRVLAPLPDLPELARRLDDRDWPRFVRERLESWLEAYCDLGQARWSSPWRERSPFSSWRAEARFDRMPEIAGLRSFRTELEALPDDAEISARIAATRLGLGPAELERYLDRLAAGLGAWAGIFRQRSWHASDETERLSSLVELLSIRLVWDALLLSSLGEPLARAWTQARSRYAGQPRLDPEAEIDLLLHAAYEHATRRRLCRQLRTAPAARVLRPEETRARPALQAAFCIDVRSERLRRALERQAPTIETIGFAGFFGVAIERVEFGHQSGLDHCPALIEPSFTIPELPQGASPDQRETLEQDVAERRRLRRAWKRFKQGAIASFSYVETLGFSHAWGLFADSFGLGSGQEQAPMDPDLEPRRSRTGERVAGIALGERVEVAAGLLAGMSLREGFARVVLLCGHEAQTTNNTHARGLDCGACGGHSGAPNARIAARILNDPAVRAGLALRGLEIPDDTLFVAGVHETVTDTVTLLDLDSPPRSHLDELDRIRTQLAAASATVRRERGPALGLSPEDADEGGGLERRTRDWSEVRNEWGLAGCTSFIIAPRERTRGLDLDGRAFLHSYTWREDQDAAVLESLMCAPMVVASWINLQYFASTVDNRTFGAGNKTLHNVVGHLGVAEGNGELRVGLPMQSVHDGEQWAHDPARLSVLIEAPEANIEGVLERHAEVRALVEGGWLHLYAIDDQGELRLRKPEGGWVEA